MRPSRSLPRRQPGPRTRQPRTHEPVRAEERARAAQVPHAGVVLVRRAGEDRERRDIVHARERDRRVSARVSVAAARRGVDGKSAAEEDGREEEAQHARELERREQVALEHAKVAGGRARVFD
jgi:hypothetical protein